MGKIFRIFTNDLGTIGRNIIAFIVIIGIVILPALYSWFNIASNWDPYSATDGIPFAVCNLDEGFTYRSLSIDAGQQIVDKLKANPKMGWQFVDEKEARRGVDNGKYYAAVIIPAAFSKNLCSLTTGEFEQSELAYYVNEKKNAIAPKITNAGISTIEQEVKTAYVNTVTNVLATMLNLTATEISGEKDTAINSVIQSLSDITNDIDGLTTGIDVFVSTLRMLKNLLSANEDLLPKIGDVLTQSGDVSANVKSAIDVTRSTSNHVIEAMERMADTTSALQQSMSKQIDDILDKVQTNAGAAADALLSLTDVSRKVISIDNYLLSALRSIESAFQLDLTALINRVETVSQRQQELSNQLAAAASTLRSTGSLSLSIIDNLKKTAAACEEELSFMLTEFQSVRSALNRAVDSAYNVLQQTTDVLQIIGEDMPKVNGVLVSTADSLDELITTFTNVKVMINNSKEKLTRIVEKAESLRGETELTTLLMQIIQDPAALSEFFSQPVTTVTHSVHGVENYGSGMSPFYTSLGIWVGGIVLCAVLRAELTEKQRKKLGAPNHTQEYFGRYLLFLLLAQIQALIVSLGDIFFLGIQCNSPLLFVGGCMISAFVYSLIIYSLTITFNVIGKALAVIILVLQVAGSGGTFPLEVLPQPFQNIAPFLPFRYGNDILREAIAGPEMSVYWNNVLLLLIFVPVALLIGLVLRHPCIRPMRFLDERIHQSDLII